MAEANVYFIDDNEAVCHATQFLFDSICNIHIKTYLNPLIFLEVFSADWLGCIIIDLDMPLMNGIDLMKKVKDINKSIGVIIMSGHGGMEAEAQALSAGAYAFIKKPYKSDYLIEQVGHILKLNG